jgi:CheY-like chemotaxis protein
MARILVVDGHDPVRWALTSLLRSAGYQVDQAANGLEALECAAETPFDAVLIDVYLPGMNGLEACRKLRQGSQVPILMVSAHHDPSLKQEAISSGANAFLLKPVEFEGLLTWVRVTLPAQAGTNSDSMAYCN